MATLTAAAARIADSFSDQQLDRKARVGIIMGLCTITLGSNICGITVGERLFHQRYTELTSEQIYGAIERVVKWFKLLLFFLLGVLMILVKAGGKRFLYQSSLTYTVLTHIIVVGRRPMGSPDYPMARSENGKRYRRWY